MKSNSIKINFVGSKIQWVEKKNYETSLPGDVQNFFQ